MQNRSFGVTALAFSSVMIALYAQFGAVALILTGSVWSPSGTAYAAASLALGALFFGLTFASYFLAYGFWTGKHWSWAGGVAVFVTLVIGSVALSIISTNFVSLVMPLAAAVAGILYLNRPAIKAELLGGEIQTAARATVPDALEGAEPAR